MSYNREWDYGKDWNSGGYRGHAREREDDEFYGEGKRRKYNNGGYQDSWQTHGDNRPYGGDGYSSHDNAYPDNYNNFGYDHSTDGRDDRSHRYPPQNRKKHIASEPSPHVIFLGLDFDFTESDALAHSQHCLLLCPDDVFPLDFIKGQSKGFGFAQFRSTEDARTFVDPNFPFITVPPPASHGASAATAYRQAIEAGTYTGKRVKIDYSQSANAAGQGRRGPQFSNDGTRDIGNTQSAVLLFRGLDPLSGPAAVAQAMRSSSGPNVEGAKGMKRVVVIKDKATLASWGYAFVEFVDAQSASAVLAATMSPQLHPSGFRISDRPVAASFAHPYSFQPIEHIMYRDETCIPSSLNLGGVDGSWVKYWDESATLATMEFKVDEPQSSNETVATKEKKAKEKKRVKASTEGSSITTKASALPISDKPVTLSFKVGPASKTAASAVPSQAALLLASNDEEATDTNGHNTYAEHPEDIKSKQAQKVPPLIASKKVVNNISKWNQVQEELSGVVHSFPAAPAPPATPPVSITPAKARSQTPEVETEFEFSDTKAITHVVTEGALSHEYNLLSVQKNFKDASLREIAREKARAAKKKEEKSDGQADQTTSKSQYRDRASERRTLFNQPDVPLPEGGTQAKGGNGKRSAEVPPSVPSPPAPVPAAAPGKDENNVGNKLLKIMGWTEGTGLGTGGEGRVDPIQAAIYASGAGLGSTKAREVGKYQDGYSGYVQMAKDVARERYEQ
ncbi:hypothetical protein A7U60_g4867 [Sanghuangporus baumii]|uniref:G-patch domain-containing protein n=1 Tax=Sanghuangporus baumii TaxID=108892 RepID=A0A9Q5N4M8_SANBA|nr:hypothetical protein A7U60_g4867 [Sanghuangporus baumii]